MSTQSRFLQPSQPFPIDVDFAVCGLLRFRLGDCNGTWTSNMQMQLKSSVFPADFYSLGRGCKSPTRFSKSTLLLLFLGIVVSVDFHSLLCPEG